MSRISIVLASLLGFATYAANAQNAAVGGAGNSLPRAEAALSNDTIELRYLGRGSEVDVKSARRVSGGFFLSEDRDVVLDAELLFPADLNLGPLSILFGPRAYAALLQEENNDIMAMSIGAEVRYDIHRRSGIAVVGHAFYAPDILTFGSADDLTDFAARAEIRLGPRLTGFAGMRWFRFDLTEGGGHEDLQDEVFVGAAYRL